MRHIAAFLAIGSSLAYGGCANQPAIDLTTPAGAAQAGRVVTAVACGAGPLVKTGRGVARKRGAKEARQIIQTIFVASKALCEANLGGQVQGTQDVPAVAVTPVAK